MSGELGALCGEKPQETAELNRVLWWDFHNRGQGLRGPCSFLIPIETKDCSKEEHCFLQRTKNEPTSGPSLSQISPLLSCTPSSTGHRLSRAFTPLCWSSAVLGHAPLPQYHSPQATSFLWASRTSSLAQGLCFLVLQPGACLLEYLYAWFIVIFSSQLHLQLSVPGLSFCSVPFCFVYSTYHYLKLSPSFPILAHPLSGPSRMQAQRGQTTGRRQFCRRMSSHPHSGLLDAELNGHRLPSTHSVPGPGCRFL